VKKLRLYKIASQKENAGTDEFTVKLCQAFKEETYINSYRKLRTEQNVDKDVNNKDSLSSFL
jgi:hypothetical protein